MLAKKAADADKGLKDLVAWQARLGKSESDGGKATQTGVTAASDMLHFRILALQTDQATDETQRAKLDQEASEVLRVLGEQHPEYRAIITEQLVSRLSDTEKLDGKGTALLQALIARGSAENFKAADQPVDEKVIARAIEAAQALSTRKEVPQAQVEDAALLIPNLQERLGHPYEAAKAYLSFAERYPNAAKAGDAVDRGFYLAFETAFHPKGTPPTDAKTFYGKALKTAVSPPWSRKQLYNRYADWLVQYNQPKEAIKYYRMVAKGDPNELNARFFELKLLNEELKNPKTDPATRAKDLTDSAALIDDVRRLAAAAPQNDQNKFRLAYTTLIGADLAIEQKQPDRALKLLQGFDAQAKAVARQSDQLQQLAIFYRAQAYMANKQFDNATREVVELAKTSPDAAKNLASELLERLHSDYERFAAQGQKTEMAETAKNEADLTDFMVHWTRSSKDPKIAKLVPAFEMFDAKIKLNAGTLAQGPAHDALLKKALDASLAIQQSVDARLVSAKNPDDEKLSRDAGLIVALSQFELKDYAAAQTSLATLIRDGKVGNAQFSASDPAKPGEFKLVDNPIYWEAYYKWLRSKTELAKADPKSAGNDSMLESARVILKRLIISNGGQPGGDKWQPQFAELRKELLPNWDPSVAATTLPSAASDPATQPTPQTPPLAGAGKPETDRGPQTQPSTSRSK